MDNDSFSGTEMFHFDLNDFIFIRQIRMHKLHLSIKVNEQKLYKKLFVLFGIKFVVAFFSLSEI